MYPKFGKVSWNLEFKLKQRSLIGSWNSKKGPYFSSLKWATTVSVSQLNLTVTLIVTLQETLDDDGDDAEDPFCYSWHLMRLMCVCYVRDKLTNFLNG